MVDIDKLEALEKHAPTKLPDGEWCLACWGMDDAHARWPCLVSRLQGEVRELRGIVEAAREVSGTLTTEYRANFLSWQRSGNSDAAEYLNLRPNPEIAAKNLRERLAEYDAGGTK